VANSSDDAALVAAYGVEAVVAAGHLVRRATDAERGITDTLVRSLPEETRTDGLSSRVKSVGSLARKLRKYADQEFASPGQVVSAIEDVVRFTIVTPTDRSLVDKTLEAVARLENEGWRVERAEHSYLRGNRYKGIHATMREPGGLAVEVQFHSEHALAVKKATTRLYSRERDQSLSAEERTAARQVMIAMADELSTPPGLAQVERLGDAAMAVKVYPGAEAPQRPNVVRSGKGADKVGYSAQRKWKGFGR
jgi:hypothetical protein